MPGFVSAGLDFDGFVIPWRIVRKILKTPFGKAVDETTPARLLVEFHFEKALRTANNDPEKALRLLEGER